MIWPSPTATTALFLPCIAQSDEINTIDPKNWTAHPEIQTSVSEEWLDIWNNGVKSQDVKDIFEAAKILLLGITPLIKVGRGKCEPWEKNECTKDWVTQMDVGIELLIRYWLHTHLPNHKLVGEEGEKPQLKAEDWVWYLDPVDGTRNFVNGKANVAMLLGIVANSEPQAGMIILPFLNQWIGGCQGQNQISHGRVDEASPQKNIIIPDNNSHYIGTEYHEFNNKEGDLYNGVLTALYAKPFQAKSIGVNILALIQRKIHSFYKPQVKLWDIMAGLVICALYRYKEYDISLYIPRDEPGVTSKIQNISPFSNKEKWLSHINKCHQKDCRVGHLIITPKSKPNIKKTILRYILNHQ